MTSELPSSLRSLAVYPSGAEPVAHAGSGTGLLVLHGFTGSPWEIQPLCAKAMAAGWSVAAPVLPGHATHVRALDAVRWQDWLAAAQQAGDWLDGRCHTVHIVGFSMGALLATLLAETRSPTASPRLVLLAPAFGLAPVPTWVLRGLGASGLVALLGKADPLLPNGERPPCYGAVPVRGANEFLDLAAFVVAKRRSLGQAILLVHGQRDRTIDPARAEAAVRQCLGRGLQAHRVAASGHLLLRDRGANEALGLIADFLGFALPEHESRRPSR